MTTIILVSIGVLIAAVAALFVIFYGGDAFNETDSKAEAARLVGEGVQIQAAYQAFRAQEDRMPGKTDTGVDSFAVKDLMCKKYLDRMPKGLNAKNSVSYSDEECADEDLVKADGTPWKIDYRYGIARSIVGIAKDEDGNDTKATEICRAARKQMNLEGNPKRCDAGDISNLEPCCIMSADDAAA